MFAKRNLDGVLGRLRVPLLVLHGENDRQAPLWHAERTVAEAVNSPQVEYKVFSLSEGSAEHCGIDNAGMHANYLFDWVAQAPQRLTSPCAFRRHRWLSFFTRVVIETFKKSLKTTA